MCDPVRRSEETVLEMPDIPYEWQVASPSLAGLLQVSRARVFTMMAKTYDELADGPIEIGKFQGFDLPGVSPHVDVVIHGDNSKKKRDGQDLKRIRQYTTKHT